MPELTASAKVRLEESCNAEAQRCVDVSLMLMAWRRVHLEGHSTRLSLTEWT